MFKTVDKAPSTSLELLDVPLVRRRRSASYLTPSPWS